VVEVHEYDVFGYRFVTSRLPVELDHDGRVRFEELWSLHPERFHEITQPFTGKRIPLPRWQQAYGCDYRYTGNVNRALPIPAMLEPYLAWVQAAFDARLNGLLLNWYDGAKRHYIGPHRDSTSGLVEGAPIVTISLGAGRSFRLRPVKGKGVLPFDATHGTVFVLPWESNLHLRHDVPHRAKDAGRRISITVRAFET
jgi:alkylated DNA repair dioxygenase AlkB